MNFVQAETGEVKEFFPRFYENADNRAQLAKRADFFESAEGTRIDLKPDGSYQEKHGRVWVPQ